MHKDNTPESSPFANIGEPTLRDAETRSANAFPAAEPSSPLAASTAAATPASETIPARMIIIVGDMIGGWNRNRVRRGYTGFANTASCEQLAREIIGVVLENKP